MYVGEAIAGVIGKVRCLQRIDSRTARIVTQGSQPSGDSIHRNRGTCLPMPTCLTKLCGPLRWILIGGAYENDR